MGLLFKSKRQKEQEMLEEAMKVARSKQRTFICPGCRTRYTVGFAGKGDYYTCKKCGYRTYAKDVW